MPQDTDVSRQSSASPNRSATRSVGRDESLDVAKGFGILLVVLGHCLIGLRSSTFFPATLQWPILTIYGIYFFHMPLFFVVSGHLASGKHRPVGSTVGKLVLTIAYPYFLWSILQGLSEIYLSKYTNGHESISSLYRIFWVPIVPYWFLYALFFCHLGYLAIRKLSHPVQLGIAVVVFMVPLFFIEPLSQAYLQIVLQTVRGFLYFVLGVVSVTQVRQLGRWAAVAATTLFVVFAVVAVQSQLRGLVGTIAELPAAIAGIVATLAWSRMLAAQPGPQPGTFRGRTVSIFAFLGRYSMSIYVMHIFFTAGVRIALKRVGTQPTPAGTVLEIVAAVGVGILLPLGINWVVSKVNLDAWFGTQHMETN
jgi:fucose 4-O-acetylase-like acetyltransferase